MRDRALILWKKEFTGPQGSQRLRKHCSTHFPQYTIVYRTTIALDNQNPYLQWHPKSTQLSAIQPIILRGILNEICTAFDKYRASISINGLFDCAIPNVKLTRCCILWADFHELQIQRKRNVADYSKLHPVIRKVKLQKTLQDSGKLDRDSRWLHTACSRGVESGWNVMAHGDAQEEKWWGNWRMEWVASTLHTTSQHGVSSITTADAQNSAANSRLNWRPRRFKWTRPFRRKTKSFCMCVITFQTQSTNLVRHVAWATKFGMVAPNICGY